MFETEFDAGAYWGMDFKAGYGRWADFSESRLQVPYGTEPPEDRYKSVAPRDGQVYFQIVD